MDEKSLYAHILNLSAPWQVQSLYLMERLLSVSMIRVALLQWHYGKLTILHNQVFMPPR